MGKLSRCGKKMKEVKAEASYQLDIVFVESSPELSVKLQRFYETLKRSFGSLKSKKPTHKLLEIEMKPDISIEEFQKRVDELFFTFDKDNSLMLDPREFVEFKQAYIGICMSCTATDKSTKTENFDFDEYFFDKEKLGLLDNFVAEKQKELDD